eukprot:2705151-Pyramimonas_sp.AAC.1
MGSMGRLSWMRQSAGQPCNRLAPWVPPAISTGLAWGVCVASLPPWGTEGGAGATLLLTAHGYGR